jgi:anti-sigma factor RsiW
MNTCDDVRLSLGALAVGALPIDEEQHLREHVAGCPDCARELAELTETASWLARTDIDAVVAAPPEPSAEMFPRLLARVQASRRRTRVASWAVAMAAAVAMVVAGLALMDRGEDAAVPVVAPAATVSAVDGGIAMEVSAWERDWGTAVEVEVSGVPGGYRCSLVAIGADGTREVAATWSVPDAGYNGAGRLVVDGALGLRLPEIERYEIVTTAGDVLVSADSE